MSGTAEDVLTCEADGAATRLRCSECQAPICPACFVRTDVGLRCQTCAAPSGPPVTAFGPERRTPILAVVAVVVTLLVAGGAWVATRGGTVAVDDVSEGGERIVIPKLALGSGEFPGGISWTLDARREGGVCTVFNVTPGPPATERCLRRGSYRPVGNLFTRILRPPSGSHYLTLGQVSDRTARVRIAPDDAPEFDLPVMGADTGLEVRFFVLHQTENVAMTITAYADDGTELGRLDRPKLPTR
jgi:hypothetical protein